jgi:hypothetical protein
MIQILDQTFSHTGNCAGISVSRHLLHNGGRYVNIDATAGAELNGHLSLRRIHSGSHLAADPYETLVGTARDRWAVLNNSTVYCLGGTVCVVRDPLTRFAGMWAANATALTLADFGTWLARLRYFKPSTVDMCNERNYAFVPCAWYAEHASTIIRYEQFDLDVNRWYASIGLAANHKHFNSHRGCFDTLGIHDWRELYTVEQRRLVRELYAEDCERFGYVVEV